MSKHTADDIETGLAAVAQSLINIAEGVTTIERDSRLYKGMSLLMKPETASVMRGAPEMLEALKTLKTWIVARKSAADDREAYDASIDLARAAIARAEGRDE